MRFVALSLVLLMIAIGAVGFHFGRRDRAVRAPVAVGAPALVPMPRITVRAREAMHVVYLNREGALLRAAPKNDSVRNGSTIVQSFGAQAVAIPAYAGTPRKWVEFVECVRDRFAPYDVEVVDQRPVEPGYIMAVVGGRPSDLPATDAHGHTRRVTGLAPYNGQPVEDAVVLVVSRELEARPRDVCETAAMEIAHAYGLDHSRDCGEVMTHMPPCGARRFLDRDLRCGEHEDRECGDGATTQNSHRRLLAVLGAARSRAQAQR